MTKNYLITPGKVGGNIPIPPSKSHSLRAHLFASLAEGPCKIIGSLESPDTRAMQKACKREGDVIDAGNSGIVARFWTALASLDSSKTTIIGDLSLQKIRKIEPLADALRQLGVSVETDGYLPITVKGPWRGSEAILSGEDSQHVSALLIAASFAPFPVTIHVKNPGERPWIDLTLKWLDFLNLKYQRDGYTTFKLAGQGRVAPFTYTVPADLSSLAFPVGAALVTESKISYSPVDFTDSQGDKKLFDVFREMGAVITNSSAVGKPMRAVQVDLNDCIDAVPILAACACFAKGETVIKNIQGAREKECDRLFAMECELKKMGAKIEASKDALMIEGDELYGAKVESHNDHRVAMALSIAALGAKGETLVCDTGCVDKTYPGFASVIPNISEVL